MKRFILSALLATTALLPLVSLSGNASAAEVDHRDLNQRTRVVQGERRGTLTPRELRNLEQRQTAANNTRYAELSRNHGRLTPQQQHRLNVREANLSRTIHQDRHH